MRSLTHHPAVGRTFQRTTLCLAVAALLFAIATPTAATALPVNDFLGSYVPGNWATSNVGGGSVNTGGAPNSIQLIGSDSGVGLGTTVNHVTDFTIAVLGTGTWSFHFDWQNSDDCCGAFDFAGFLHKGNLIEEFSGDLVGDRSIAVAAGDVIGYRVRCTDCVAGPGFLNISSFAAPLDEVVVPSVPEPGTLMLLGVGAAGLVAGRRLRRR